GVSRLAVPEPGQLLQQVPVAAARGRRVPGPQGPHGPVAEGKLDDTGVVAAELVVPGRGAGVQTRVGEQAPAADPAVVEPGGRVGRAGGDAGLLADEQGVTGPVRGGDDRQGVLRAVGEDALPLAIGGAGALPKAALDAEVVGPAVRRGRLGPTGVVVVPAEGE